MADLSWRTKRKGYWLFKDGKIKKDVDSEKRIHLNVESDGRSHSVIFDKTKHAYTCDCEFFSLKLKDCSHIHAARLFLEGEKNEEG